MIAEIVIPSVFKFITTPDWVNIIVLCILLTALLCFKEYLTLSLQRFFSSLTNKYFMLSLAGLAIIGASAALFIPSYTNWFRENDSTKTQQPISTPQPTQSGQDTGNQQKQESKNPASELRGHLLYITGGVIAVLGLIETNRKNSQDHIRQVHATRRERYIEAVDKLSSKEAPVRLGGVYALVGLVDEWLDDDNINRETQIKEGQIIINNLCSYIRSPFPLAEKIEEYEARKELEKLQKTDSEKLSKKDSSRLQILLKRFKDSDEYEKSKDITADYAKLHEEQDVRRAIFDEIHKRSSNIVKDEKGKIVETIPGLWSDFDFNFSRAPIFYPLNNLTIEKGNFSSAKFYSEASFSKTTFAQDADFSGAIFALDADFSRAIFALDADFSGATFTKDADFSEAIFTQDAFFMLVTFAQDAFFMSATFTQYAIFISATFTQYAFFQSATFTQDTIFMSATFTEEADFRGAVFIQKVNFNNACFENYEPTFADEQLKAQFSAAMNPHDYNFSVTTKSKPTNLGTATLLGKTFKIPLGTVLFDPKSLDKKTGEYTRVSPPAQ